MAQNSPMEECICREDWGESGGIGKTPQPEAFEKQAGWVESSGKGKVPQLEADRKQAGWVESSGKGKTPQWKNAYAGASAGKVG